jgi:tetratricopeptide (TPR) repeat protein
MGFLIWENLKKAFIEPTAFIYYRPLFMDSLIIDYHFGKLNPFYYHFSNLVLHLTCVLLLFGFLTQFKVYKKTAFFLTLIFAIHPLMLHSVAWIPGRNDTMLCLFTLSSLIFLNRYLSDGKIKYFILHILFFICALFTKENAVALPFVFSFMYYIHPKKERKDFFISVSCWMIITLLWFILRRSVVDYSPDLEENIFPIFKNVLFAFLGFVGKTFIPAGQSVFPTLKNSPIIPGVIALAVFIVLWITCKPKNKALAFLGVFLFFILLIIPIGFGVLRSPGEQYEHRIYTSMAGLLLFLSQLNYNINSKWITSVFVAFIIFFAVRTYMRMDVYKDKLSFLNAGIKESPEYYYFYLAKGEVLYKNKNYTEALFNFDEAIKKNPSRPQTYNSRANVYVALGRSKEAIEDYTKALDKSKANTAVLMQRCIAYYNSGDIENAIKDLDALKKCCQNQVNPDMEKTMTEKWEQEKWKRRIASDPKNTSLYIERAGFFMEKRMGKEALADLRKACELEPGNKTYRTYYLELLNSLPH